MPSTVPSPNSYSLRICSNSSTFAFLSIPRLLLLQQDASGLRGGPFYSIEMGRFRVSKSGGARSRGDGTSILADLLKQKPQRAVVGNIADPAAVKLAIQAGVGKQLTLTVGARIDQFRGDPVEIS